MILGKQTSFQVVSNGADCLLVSKQFFVDNMSDSLYRRLRLEVSSFIYTVHIHSDTHTHTVTYTVTHIQ